MHLTYIDDNVIFIHDKKDIDFDDIDELKEYFKTIFIRLKNELEPYGYYLVKVYKDINGMIIEFEELDLYSEELEMKIIIEEVEFLYQIEDIFIDKCLLDGVDIIEHSNKLYLKVKNKLNNIKIGYLYEISKLLYKDTLNIIKCGKYLSLKKTLNLI